MSSWNITHQVCHGAAAIPYLVSKLHVWASILMILSYSYLGGEQRPLAWPRYPCYYWYAVRTSKWAVQQGSAKFPVLWCSLSRSFTCLFAISYPLPSLLILFFKDKNAQVKEIRARFNSWNMTLDKAIRSFVADKSTTDDPITAIYFSSHRVFTALLNHPKKYGFPQKDIAKSRRSIWIDHLHPTSAVHHILASELDSLLSSISPFAPCRHWGVNAKLELSVKWKLRELNVEIFA